MDLNYLTRFFFKFTKNYTEHGSHKKNFQYFIKIL